jgi:hypothetical protein
MFGDYSILDKSMNGVKTLSDGISFIENGKANHNELIYNDFIKSADDQTTLTNDTITTENIFTQNLNAANIAADDMNADVLTCDYFYVKDVSNNLFNVLEVNGAVKRLNHSEQVNSSAMLL